MHKHKLLVVDDDQEMVTLMSDFLRQQGYEICSAGSGRTALALMHAHSEANLPQVIISDVKMSPGDGLHLAQVVRSKWPQIPVILMSAFGGQGFEAAAFEAGAILYFPKPFRLIHVAGAIGKLLPRNTNKKEEENGSPKR
jgi:DNA-binding response OmpR family regulator